MDTAYMSEKKRNRLESKKRKAEAFLALVGHTKSTESNTSASDHIQSHDTSLRSTTFFPDSVSRSRSNDTMAAVEDEERQNSSGKECPKTNSVDPVEEMKAIIRARKKASMQKPKVFLTLEEMAAFRPVPQEPVTDDEIPPLFVMDLQQLLLNGIQGNRASYKPRWCKILRITKLASVVLLMVDNLSYDDYMANKDHFPHLSDSFDNPVEMVCPMQYGHRVEEELFNVPLSVSQLKKANVRVPRAIQESVVAKIGQPTPNPSVEKFSRKCLLLSTYQMIQNGYPLPVKTKADKYRGFVFTKDSYEKVTPSSPLFAVDCEMVVTIKNKSELARVSIVSEDGQPVYDELVKPRNAIINYVTKFSGITAELLKPVTKRIEDVQREIKELLPPDAILCGQSLNGDLLSLKVFHPYVIDTSVIFNMSGNRGVRAGLRKLSQFFLGRTIQASQGGHCSTEDATAALDLVKLKLRNGLEFGDATLSGVYFPDIQTYFMGAEGGGKQVPENVDKSNADQANTAESLASKEDNTEETTSLSSTQQNSITVDDKDKHSISNKCHDTSSPTSNNDPNIANQSSLLKSSSSSSSSDSENDSVLNDKASPHKKRKLDNSGSEMSCSTTSEKCKSEESPADSKPSRSLQEHFSPDVTLSGQLSTVNFVRVQQEHLFNQDNSVHIPHSLFHLTREAGRTACVIDHEAHITTYESEPTEKLFVTSDTEVRRKTKQCVQTSEFVMAQFRELPAAAEADTDLVTEAMQKEMRRLDKRLHSVLKKIPPNALVTVVFKGRHGETAAHNMATFIKTT